MSDWTQFVKLLHIASAMALVAGGVGRQVLRAQAARQDNIRIVKAYIDLAHVFDRTVILSSMLTLVFGVILSLTRGWPMLGFIQGASQNWLLVSIILFVFGPIPLVSRIFIPHREAVNAAMEPALEQGIVTSELKALLNDRKNAIAHRVEEAILVVVLVLMVLKPF